MQIKAAHLGKTAHQRASAQADFDKLAKKPSEHREKSVPNAKKYESPAAQPSKQPELAAMEGHFFHFGLGKRQLYRDAQGQPLYLDVRDHSPVPLVIGRPVDLASCVRGHVSPTAKPQTKARHKARKPTTH